MLLGGFWDVEAFIVWAWGLFVCVCSEGNEVTEKESVMLLFKRLPILDVNGSYWT